MTACLKLECLKTCAIIISPTPAPSASKTIGRQMQSKFVVNHMTINSCALPFVCLFIVSGVCVIRKCRQMCTRTRRQALYVCAKSTSCSLCDWMSPRSSKYESLANKPVVALLFGVVYDLSHMYLPGLMLLLLLPGCDNVFDVFVDCSI